MSSKDTSIQRHAEIYQNGTLAGVLEESADQSCQFRYVEGYAGIPISLTMPLQSDAYHFKRFPPVFDGLLPEGPQLEALLRKHKIDRSDTFTQLITVGEDLVGSLSVRLPKKQSGTIQESE